LSVNPNHTGNVATADPLQKKQRERNKEKLFFSFYERASESKKSAKTKNAKSISESSIFNKIKYPD
jgi:hypothetical protein